MTSAQTGFSLIKTDTGVRFAPTIPRTSAAPVLYIADHPDHGVVSFNLNGVRYRTQGFRLIIIGSSGSGKSYALGVIAEEVHRAGIPFFVFDQESEFAGLAALPGVQIIEPDTPTWDPLPAVNFTLRDGGAIVLDVGELGLTDQRDVFTNLARVYYQVAGTVKRRNVFLLDEAAEIAPQRSQRGAGSSREWLERFARRGRKRGINWGVATQRPSELSKNVFAQGNVKLIGRVEIVNDLDAIKPYLTQRLNMQTISRLNPGDFLLDLPGATEIIHIRPRQTEDLGGTPT
jgi:DNA helicase HerA-like ATPase